MSVSQNVSAIFNSPQIAPMALQAVTAGELAERQGLARLQRETLRREHQVLGSESEAEAEAVGARAPGLAPPPAGIRRKKTSQGPAGGAAEAFPDAGADAGPEPGPGRHINLMA